MNNKLEQIVQLFADNENAEAQLKQAKTVEDAVAILAQYGIDLTVDEFKEIGREVTNDELSEDMLEFVSGGKGFWSKAWRGVKDFFHGFLDAF